MKNETSILSRLLKLLPIYPIVNHKLEKKPSVEEHWARTVMNREVREMISRLYPDNLESLEISGTTWSNMSFKSYKSIHYPDFDICESSLDEMFDLIIAEQVFEHLLWPYRAGKNVHKMLKSDGYFLITTPFLLRVHNFPIYCSRWTETGIKYFLAECGFDIERIQTGSWGNRACIQANFLNWAIYRPWFHSLKNEPDFSVVVWALAQK